MNPYWPHHALGKTPNISHATTTGLESAGKKYLNPTVPELIEGTYGIGDDEDPRISISRSRNSDLVCVLESIPIYTEAARS